MTMRRWIPLVACIASAVLYAALSIRMWVTFQVPSWDLGIFTQLAKAYASFDTPIVPIKGPDFNLLGDHFHPILIALAPVYWIYPSGLSLLLAQAFLFASSVYPITRLACERYGALVGSLIGFSYLASWGLLNAIWSQFHEIAFAVPLLAWGLTAYMRGQLRTSLVLLGALVFVKEDLGLTVAMFGAVLYLRDRTRITEALGMAAWGMFWFVASTFLILPALNPGGNWDYSQNVSEDIWTGLSLKVAFCSVLILSSGLLALRSPIMLLVLPTMAWRFVGNVEYYWGWDFHYSAVLIPIIMCALIDGARQWALPASLLSVATTSFMLTMTQVGSIMSTDHSEMKPAIEVARGYDVVVSDVKPLAYLVPDTTVYWSGTRGDIIPDAVIMNTENHPEGIVAWAETNLGGRWVTVYHDRGWQVVEPAE